MKVIVQIPCFNEENTIARTLADIPCRIAGVDRVEILIIDDGSTDATSSVAKKSGADHVVRHCGRRGLAAAFATGLETCLRLGADVIVNTDGDNQYAGADIPRLVQPILSGEAEIVIGDRQIASSPHFSRFKRLLEWCGSFAVGTITGMRLPDAVSGFRAFSRSAAMRLNVVSSFSYTIETLVQARSQRMVVLSVPVGTNPPTRDSRLFSSVPQFITRSLTTLIRAFAMHRPLALLFPVGLILVVIGLVPILRFLILYVFGHGEGHVQSLVLGSVSLLIGILTFMIGLVAELTAFNRQLLVIVLEKIRQVEYDQQHFDAHTSMASGQSRPHSRISESNNVKVGDNDQTTNLHKDRESQTDSIIRSQ